MKTIKIYIPLRSYTEKHFQNMRFLLENLNGVELASLIDDTFTLKADNKTVEFIKYLQDLDCLIVLEE